MSLQKSIASANLGLPSGSVVDTQGPGAAAGARMLTVQTGEFLRDAADVGELVVGTHQGRPVHLRAVPAAAVAPSAWLGIQGVPDATSFAKGELA